MVETFTNSQHQEEMALWFIEVCIHSRAFIALVSVEGYSDSHLSQGFLFP